MARIFITDAPFVRERVLSSEIWRPARGENGAEGLIGLPRGRRIGVAWHNGFGSLWPMDPKEPGDEPAPKKKGSLVGAGIGIGIAIGAGIGAAIHNVGAGVALGISLGIVLGAALEKQRRKSG